MPEREPSETAIDAAADAVTQRPYGEPAEYTAKATLDAARAEPSLEALILPLSWSAPKKGETDGPGPR